MSIKKQDFNNILDLEIGKLEKELSLIKEEISIRKGLGPMDALEVVKNQRMIFELEKQVLSKEDFLDKLREKKMFDAAELEEDYVYALNNSGDIIEKVKTIEDPHMKVMAEYEAAEMDLYIAESNKEAVVFYYRGLKEIFESLGVEL
jgi:hypothetical protein